MKSHLSFLFTSSLPLCPLPCTLSSPSPQIISWSSSPLPPSLCLSPLPYFSICLILARPLTHKSNTGHLNTICLLPMESRMGWREQRGESMAPLTVSPLTRFHIHLPIASSTSSSPLPLSFFLFCSKLSGVFTEAPNADTAPSHTQK